MLDLLGKLHTLKGQLVRRRRTPRGYEVTTHTNKDSVAFWFPTVVGRGVLTRGLVDERGHLTPLGGQTIKKHQATKDAAR